MILFVKNISIEGPETLADFFLDKGFDLQMVDLSREEKLPENLVSLEAVVVLGGPMNVDEEEKYPFLREEVAWIRRIITERIPFLGICLGAQLLAKAAGACVTKNPVAEIGFKDISLTRAGEHDPLFEGLAPRLKVFQWHGDTFTIPEQGRCLAQSLACAHQALRVGDVAYGLQFHVEITGQSIFYWTEAYCKAEEREAVRAVMLQDYHKEKDAFHQHARMIYQNFYQLISSGNEVLR